LDSAVLGILLYLAKGNPFSLSGESGCGALGKARERTSYKIYRTAVQR